MEDIHIDEVEDVQSIDLVNFGRYKQEDLQKATAESPTLQELSRVIASGWPDTIKELPKDIRPYWSYRDELGLSSGVVFKGCQVIIPEPLQEDILNQLHESHMGIEKTRRLARQSVYWPGMNDDISQMIKRCGICQELQPSNHKEPLIPHEIPSTPWTKIAHLPSRKANFRRSRKNCRGGLPGKSVRSGSCCPSLASCHSRPSASQQVVSFSAV